ncbi:MAG: competence/damage-inducible protein A [Rhodospirillales bacterium 12-71-4]|nr:MAG: competence/damage-inducible protein A [Rhodospirillales bacterium 12-71-4]
MNAANPTACLLVIGNEVLSGRTKDANINFLATRLGEIGIPLREVRIIPDVRATIIDTLNEVRDSAFGVPWEPHPEAWARLERHYRPGEFNAARQRMATMPRGAALIDNAISIAPGFTMGNVHVLAGVPRIMQAMFEALAPTLEGGPPVASRTVHADGVMEGRIAEGLAAIQARWPGLDIGSYPYYRMGGGGVALVAKGQDATAVAAAAQDITVLLRAMGSHPAQGEPPV